MRSPVAAARLALAPVLIALLALTACSTPKAQLQSARQLEMSGRFTTAAARYRDLLELVPRNQPRVRAELEVRIGECLVKSGQLAEAAHSFERAVQLDDNVLVAHLRLAQIYVAGSAPEAALKEAEYVLAREPQNLDASIVAGAAYGALGQPKLARSFLEKAYDRDPARENVALTLAEIRYDQHDAPGARVVLETTGRLNPRSPAAWLALGRIEEREGNNAGAEEAYRRAVAVDNTPATNLRLAQFLQRSARMTEAREVLARVDQQRPALPIAVADFELFSGRPQQAEESYLAALARSLAPAASSPPADRGAIAARLVEADLQRAASDRGALSVAQVHLQQFRSGMDPATVAVLEAEIALAGNNLAQAVPAAERAVELAGDSAAAHYILGEARLLSADGAGALLEWNRALEQDPGFVPAHMALAREAYHAGSQQLAEEHVASVVRDEPGNFAALDLYARVLAAQRRFDAAESIARRAASIRKEAPEPHIVLGNLALDRGMAGAALLEFEQAVLLDPHSQAAMDGLIRTYRRGTVTRAILSNMERTAHAAPASPTLLEIAGRLYADRRWYDDAERCLKAALRMDPGRSTAHSELVRVYLADGKLSAAMAAAERGNGARADLVAGLRAEQRDDPSTAIREYEAALPRDTTGIAANNLAWLYARQGRNLDRALELARSAHGRHPNDPAVLDTIGFVHLQRREYSDAINFLRQAVSIVTGPVARRLFAPDEVAEFHRHLAEAYLKAGQPQDAAAELSRIDR